jgi:hypothetical protein
MKPFYLVPPLVLAGLMLLAAAPDASAKAFKGGVIDPPAACIPASICIIPPPAGEPSDVGSFIDCAVIGNTKLDGMTGFNYCLWLTNNTGVGISKFNFSIPFDRGIVTGSDTLSCLPITDSSVTVSPVHCTIDMTNRLFDLSFTSDIPVASGTGTIILAMSLGDDAYTTENGFGPIAATFSVPEPGELGLFGLGLLAIGVGYGCAKRRQSRRTCSAA